MPQIIVKLSIFAGLLFGLLVGATQLGAEEKNERSPLNSSSEVAVIKTNEGEMVIEFWSDAVPKTVENFKKDPAKENSYGQGGPGYKIKAEFNNHSHERGVISMARGPDPDSAGSQFFICLAPAPRLDGQYTTFGKLIKGDDVLEGIGDTPVTRNSTGENSKPTKRVVIESVKIVPANSVK